MERKKSIIFLFFAILGAFFVAEISFNYFDFFDDYQCTKFNLTGEPECIDFSLLRDAQCTSFCHSEGFDKGLCRPDMDTIRENETKMMNFYKDILLNSYWCTGGTCNYRYQEFSRLVGCTGEHYCGCYDEEKSGFSTNIKTLSLIISVLPFEIACEDKCTNSGNKDTADSDEKKYSTCNSYCHSLGGGKISEYGYVYTGSCLPDSNIHSIDGCSVWSEPRQHAACSYIIEKYETVGAFDCQDKEYCICWTSEKCGSGITDCYEKCTLEGCTE